MLEQKIVEHCAPTLAGMKIANLFNCRYEDFGTLVAEVWGQNQKLNPKGVHLEILRIDSEHALIYVYRPKMLREELARPDVQEVLKMFGYQTFTEDACLRWLCDRLRTCKCFPHEIGIFLGYPLADVIGFIEQKGRNCKCCGFWKVYCDEQEAKKTFAKYEKCSAVYRRVFSDGRSITQLTVAG
jgi:hypothetical protein